MGGGFFLAQAQVVKTRPRPPKAIMEVKPCGPKQTWIPGHWQWESHTARYRWVLGHCERIKRGKQYVPGRWQLQTGGWHWMPGYWESI